MRKLALFGYERPHGATASMAFKLAGRLVEALQCADLFDTGDVDDRLGLLDRKDRI